MPGQEREPKHAGSKTIIFESIDESVVLTRGDRSRENRENAKRSRARGNNSREILGNIRSCVYLNSPIISHRIYSEEILTLLSKFQRLTSRAFLISKRFFVLYFFMNVTRSLKN